MVDLFTPSPALSSPPKWYTPPHFGALQQEIIRAKAKAVGVVIDPSLLFPPNELLAATNARNFEEREHRVALSLGVAPQNRRVIGLRGPGFSSVDALKALWNGESPPYAVFYGGQRALHLLAERGIFPPRLGCLRTASYLFSRAKGQSPGDDRPQHHLEEVWNQQFDTKLDTENRLAHEADALLSLMTFYTAKLRELQLVRAFELECRLLPAVVDMEKAGFYIDAPGYEAIAQSWQQSLAKSQDPAEQKALQKLLSTYRWWCRDYVDADQRIRCHLDPLATASGRFSCSQPNLQQVPNTYTAPGLRACFKAPPGKALIIADYAQIEMRVAAHLAGCEKLRALFRAGYDPHRATAAALSQKPMAEVDDHERKLAKAVNFGFLFGMGAKRFQSYAQQSYGLDLDPAEAQAARRSFFQAYPGIARWHQQTSQKARGATHRQSRVTTALGRSIGFAPGKLSFNAALNIPVQGSAAEGFKAAMLRLHGELPKLGARGILCVHDEFIAEAPLEQAPLVRQRVQSIMEEEMQRLIDSLPIVVDAQIAEHWS